VGSRSANGGAADRGGAVASEASMPGRPID
jgi:hypothetical protein